MTGNLPPLIIVLGPTGVGKTDLAIELALRLNGQIIGAGQPPSLLPPETSALPNQQRNNAPRSPTIWSIFVEPDYNLSLAEYQDNACQTINSLHQQGILPMLVGGSGQYITAVEEGWLIPRVAPNLELRAELEAFVANNSAQALHDQLRQVDPVSAQNIHPNNTRRVIRALEVHRHTGQAISKLQKKRPPPYRIRSIGLRMDRAKLYPRVDQRVDRMIEAGFVAEVQGLLDMGYDRQLPSLTGLGYLEIAQHLLDGKPLEAAIERTKFSTHEFIRSQDVWFRGHDNGILWHNVEKIESASLARDLQSWIGSGP